MKNNFNDILSLDDVTGVMLFSFKGEIMVTEFLSASPVDDLKDADWWDTFVKALNGIREAELIFEKGRLYIRETKFGYILIVMGMFAPVTMVRLNCDVLIPALQDTRQKKGWLFKRR